MSVPSAERPRPYEVCVCFLVRAAGGSHRVDAGAGHDRSGAASDQREVLLGRKLRGLGAGLLVGPGGKVEAGESAVEAVAREVAEECSVVLDPGRLRVAGRVRYQFPSRPSWDQNSTVFVAGGWTGDPQPSAELEPGWHAVERVPYARMWDDARLWLPQVLAGGTVDAYFRFGSDLSTVEAWASADAGGSMSWQPLPRR